jgi:hypothetical protein
MLKKFFPLILVILSACEGCDKEDPKPLTELEKLPPATQEGKYTFGCLVNGKALTNRTTLETVAIYQIGILQIGLSNETEPEQNIGISLTEQVTPLTVGNYDLVLTSAARAVYSKYQDGMPLCLYFDTDILNGNLEITKFDKINYILSGLFEFTSVNSQCDTLKVTDGRFDFKYIP